jgi:hypothetical protein
MANIQTVMRMIRVHVLILSAYMSTCNCNVLTKKSCSLLLYFIVENADTLSLVHCTFASVCIFIDNRLSVRINGYDMYWLHFKTK